jgi:glycosyltransferase involved in cell wall biosynthesis
VNILHVGRLERAKGVFTLAEVIPDLIAKVPDIRVIFVGSTRQLPQGQTVEEAIRDRLAKAGCLDHVEFTGYLGQRELRDQYRRAAICVVPSQLYESFSYTCAEAMAAGRPVVASRIGGIPEVVVDGRCGILVESGCPAELSEAIVRLARDPQLCREMGTSGRSRVHELYDPQRVAAANLSVYRSICAGATAP